ncbi:Glutamate receptor 2.8 [Acorus gramineus]|uniref:Glutamate receptor 2.8 n=1 Tax=Acorus gramineus TaxID=55184 RepID=A0AAV9BI64_ACOGR|nr:Glutamate receptor 2.8 [Acorus gramineus]
MPYIKIFLAKHCSDYMMIGPTYRADGYGFVFPRGSPLVGDVSRAILNVTQGDGMIRNEKKWFGNLTTCGADGGGGRATGISFRSFWGLFLITGLTTTLALLVSIILYMKENWDEMKAMASGDSVWQSLVAVSRHYDKPHPSMRRTPTFVDGKFFDAGPDHVVEIESRRIDDDGLRSFVSVSGQSRQGQL